MVLFRPVLALPFDISADFAKFYTDLKQLKKHHVQSKKTLRISVQMDLELLPKYTECR
jgi:hypothetical protein